MRLRSRSALPLLLPLLLLIEAPSVGDPPKKLTLAQAVRAAEEFIVLNGYTDLPPTKDVAKLSYESIEWEPDTGKMLERRRNTLERPAYGYLARSRRGAGWTVVFRFEKPSIRGGGSGRAVTMDSFGRGKRVEHVDFFLKACTRL